ncbi:MAG TPA: glycosyltransferase [Chitinophagaceae bacterium]|nr:glycosyltransferase [Chitinophagaceae bacterium]
MSIQYKQIDFCLLIPCYNNFEGLIASLKTVIYEPGDFLTVVVDDGSEISFSADSIRSRVNPGYTIVVLREEHNKGITDALNQGLKWIEENTDARYVARLDCGDLCSPDRFQKQVGYMRTHPDIGLLGSWCVFENKITGFRYNYITPTNHEQIKKAIYFRNVFIHPTVIFETKLLKKIGYYPYQFLHAEDYAFFWLWTQFSRTAILDEFLVTCEINSEGISLKNRRQQLKNRLKVIARFGTNPFLKIIAILRISALRLLPNRLVLQLKNPGTRQ